MTRYSYGVLFWEGDKLRIYFKWMERATYEHPYDGPDYRISFEMLILILHGTSTQKIIKKAL